MITDMKNAKLFSPLQLGRTTLKNRIAMAPMSMHYEATDGTVPQQLAEEPGDKRAPVHHLCAQRHAHEGKVQSDFLSHASPPLSRR